MHSLILLLISLCLPFLCLGKGKWCYDIQDASCGPSHWKIDYESCGYKKQSPINIVTRNAQSNVHLTPIIFEGYDDLDTDDKWTITNNGHSVQVTLKGDIAIKGGDLPNRYKAVQFHYHWGTKVDPGSEHTIDGEQYPMELHIVHMNEKYSDINDAVKDPEGLAVLGFMFVESPEENSKTEPLINALKTVPQPGDSKPLEPFLLKEMILDQERLKKYYRYHGSLTTPGCFEAVIWTVFEEPIRLSKGQLDAFSETLFYNASQHKALNFRPVQKRNGRIVYVSDSAVRPFDAAVLSVLLAVWSSILFN
uniref:Carbonic anhydrase n=1 Tax=Squalus acanthias TaxID=7797 RepID=Q4FCT9_SQUAC|nr:carbonic anhydrase 4 [Squalus acanthias]